MYLKAPLIIALSCVALVKAGCPLAGVEPQYFSTYTAEPLNDTQYQRFMQLNNTQYCTILVAPCDPTEGRRVDSTCNNLNYPSRGAIQTPYFRILPAEFGENFEPRLAKSGKPLPPARQVRNSLVLGGKVPHKDFTHLLTFYLNFLFGDVSVVSDTINYVLETTYCCQPEGKEDHQCTPNYVANDDPTLKYSNIRCLNMTRPYSFQYYGCRPNNTEPERINMGSPLMDLGTIYGETQAAVNKVRTFEGGRLIAEEENGMLWPPSTKSQDNFCHLNEGELETRCHDTPDSRMNTLLGFNLYGIWFWRLHNQIATVLAQLNSCWDDDKLFYTTRDILIAISQQLFYYELLPTWLGHDNMLAIGMIQDSTGFRDIYDDNLYPQASVESVYAARWVHMMQNGNMRFYDREGNYLKNMPVGNLTLRTGLLALDDNLAAITQGTFRQPCAAAADNIADTDIITQAMGPLQLVLDLPTADLAKSRYFGFPGYVKYLEHCTGKSYNTFEDLADVIPSPWIEVIKEAYEDIGDMELLAGMWLEKMMPGAQAPPTMYCLLAPQFLRNIKSDRHFYERPNRPNAFTYEQLQEIRKSTMAGFLCNVADGVTEIQPLAYVRARAGNEMTSCENIPKINFTVWKDDSCSA